MTIEFESKEALSASRLKSYLKELRKELKALDGQEPRNMDSEEYDQWAEEHEELEDQIDEVLDALDALALEE